MMFTDGLATALIAQFDSTAMGPAITLHYSEYDNAWLQDDMWQQARRLGMLTFWRKTGIKPDICNLSTHRAICAAYLAH